MVRGSWHQSYMDWRTGKDAIYVYYTFSTFWDFIEGRDVLGALWYTITGNKGDYVGCVEVHIYI